MNKQVKKKAIKIFKEIAKSYDVKLYFNQDSGAIGTAGFAFPSQSKINVIVPTDDWPDVEELVSVLFHEIAHCLNYRNKKYYAFHTVTDVAMMNKITVKYAKTVVRTGLKAERYTDKVGKQLMKKHFPHLSYKSQYKNPILVNWFQDEWLAPFKKIILDAKKKRK